MKTFTRLRDLPELTPQGFKKMSIPEDILATVNAAYSIVSKQATIEPPESFGDFITNDTRSDISYIMSLDAVPGLRDNILYAFHPILYAWVQQAITPLCIYGIRSYQRGSVLHPHVDRIATHHVSAIICVDKKVDDGQDWALDICAHDGNWHKVFLNPGEIVLYESAICQHARLNPLKGDYFNNMFLHYSLSEYSYQPY